MNFRAVEKLTGFYLADFGFVDIWMKVVLYPIKTDIIVEIILEVEFGVKQIFSISGVGIGLSSMIIFSMVVFTIVVVLS
jgi:hypothetical protein